MNKADIETISIDDLYNNFKIVKQDVKKFVGASTGAQNMAFMTAPSTSSTNDGNTAKPTYEVSTVTPNVNTASPHVGTANFSDNVMYAFMVENPNGSNLLQQDLKQIHKDDLKAVDLKWQLSLLSMRAKREYRAPGNKDGQFRYQDNTRKQRNNEDTSSKAMLAIDGVGFDWSDMAEEQVQTNMALMAFLDSEVNNDKCCTKTCLKTYETLKKQCDDLIVKLNQTEFKATTYKRGLTTIEEPLVTYRKNEVLFNEEVAVLKREVACKDYEISCLKLLGSLITDKSKKGLGYNAVSPPHHLIYNSSTKLDLSYSSLDEFKEPEFKSYGPRDNNLESNIDKKSDISKENTDDSLIKEKVSENENTSIVSPFNINCHHYQRKRMVSGNNYNRVDYDYYAKTSHPSAHRNMVPREVLLKSSLTPLNTARPVYTAQPKPTVHSARSMPRAINTARPYTTLVNVVRAKRVNVVKTLSCWVWRPTRPNGASLGKPQMDDKGFVDSGCSRHMTGNIAYLSDFKEFDRGYVTFGGETHGGRISGKGTHKTDCLDFEDILLKIPRKDNMYNFDMKNIVPKENLTCLVAKATLDESMLCIGGLGSNTEPLVSPRFTWVFFLATKDETSEILKNFIKEIENLVDKKVKIIRCDNGTEFKNKVMDDFCREKGIRREYSVARTPQQNGVAERRNRTLIEAARTMLADSKLPTTFWAEAVSTACYVQNRVLVVKPHNKTPYELFRGFKPALSFMRPFGCHVTILNTLDNLGKFDGKSDEVAAGTITNESAGTQGDLNAGTSTGKEGTSQDYIVMPIWKDASYFDSLSKDVGNDEPKSAADDIRQVEDGPHNESDDKDKSEDDSSPKEDNAAG
ncbi:putative ribonuclease H-like domain-containing protein [Tanacetum coccineum]